MPGAGLRSIARAALLTLAVVAVVFAPAAIDDPTADAGELAAAVLAPSDAGSAPAWLPAPPTRRAEIPSPVVAVAVAVAGALVAVPFRRRHHRPSPCARLRPAVVARATGRAPPHLLAV